MIGATAALTIVLMAVVTFATRVSGYLVLRGRTLGPRTRAVLDAAPACVLLAVIAPTFVTPRPAELLSLAVITAGAMRLSMFSTIVIAIGSAATFRYVLG